MATILLRKPGEPRRHSGKKIAILGYGSQGHAHALNLRDSGMDARRPLPRLQEWRRPRTRCVLTNAEACAEPDMIMVTLSDPIQGKVYEQDIVEPEGGRHAHVRPRLQHPLRHDPAAGQHRRDRYRVKALGHCARSSRKAPACRALVAVHQDFSGNWAMQNALAYAKGIGSTRRRVLETTFAEETETDLGEQAVLCGGVSELVKAGFKTLVDAGYQP